MKKFFFSEKFINYLLIFILGFLVGIAIKTEAKKRITIGYDDYLLSDMKQDFNLSKKILQIDSNNPSVQGESQPTEDVFTPETQ